MSGTGEIGCWLNDRRTASALKVEPVNFAGCEGWRLEEGRLRHETGAFFEVVGVGGAMANGGTVYQPMIDQPEVGWLGFAVRGSNNVEGAGGIEWLCQAKTEPGSVGGTQLAPTIQATRSNYRRAHKGEATRFLTAFRAGRAFCSDAPFSEQGTRFLYKFNRNSTLAVRPDDPAFACDDPRWRWIGSAVLREALGASYIVNTDARSAIATAPWSLLGARYGLFRAPVLQRSYTAPKQAVAGLISRLLVRGEAARPWELLPLHAIPSTRMTDGMLADDKGRALVRAYAVEARDREVGAWCQPFLEQPEDGHSTLLTRLESGRMEVFVRAYSELGFAGRWEFGPSIHAAFSTPPELREMALNGPLTLAEIEQSDEGGRFMLARSTYRVVHLPHAPARRRYPFGEWIGLGAFERLVRQPARTTNELRTLASLLLSEAFDRAASDL